MSKRGRPKLPDKHRRSITEHVRMSLKEEEILREVELLMGMTKSDVLREGLNLYYMTYIAKNKE